MTKPIDIILLLMDPNADHRAAVKTAWEEDIEEFWVGLDMATSKLDFGISSVPALDLADTEVGSLTFSKFFTLAMSLADGKIKGPMAESFIEEAALSANSVEWNFWYRRILLKSLHKYLPILLIQDELKHLTSE